MKVNEMTTGQKIGAGVATGGIVFLVIGLVKLFKKNKSNEVVCEEDEDQDNNYEDEETESSETSEEITEAE